MFRTLASCICRSVEPSTGRHRSLTPRIARDAAEGPSTSPSCRPRAVPMGPLLPGLRGLHRTLPFRGADRCEPLPHLALLPSPRLRGSTPLLLLQPRYYRFSENQVRSSWAPWACVIATAKTTLPQLFRHSSAPALRCRKSFDFPRCRPQKVVHVLHGFALALSRDLQHQ